MFGFLTEPPKSFIRAAQPVSRIRGRVSRCARRMGTLLPQARVPRCTAGGPPGAAARIRRPMPEADSPRRPPGGEMAQIASFRGARDLPHNLEAEQAVLGAILLEETAFDQVAPLL